MECSLAEVIQTVKVEQVFEFSFPDPIPVLVLLYFIHTFYLNPVMNENPKTFRYHVVTTAKCLKFYG